MNLAERLAACAALIAAALLFSTPARAQTPIVLDGTIADGTPQYFSLPFTVPDGIAEIEFRHDDLSTANILDWGLRDPGRFRGWGGGNTEPAIVTAQAATRSYVPGPIVAGVWSVMIGQARVSERPARYHVEILLRAAPTLAAQPERRTYAHVPALATGPRWFAGDFHVHSRESGDASPTLDQIAAFARMRGLDFIELSDHNIVTQHDFISDAQTRHPNLLFVPGTEFTTYQGHANAIGATQWVDFTLGSSPSVTIDRAAESIAMQGAVLAINHPVLDLGDQCTGCAWQLDLGTRPVGAVEIQNGQYSTTGALFFRRSIQFWETLLARGQHTAPIGGSDDHSAGRGTGMFDSPIGGPTTMVYARELSAPAIVEAVAAGRTVVKLQSAADPMVDLTAGTSRIGDTVRARSVTLRAVVTGGMGASLRFVRNGMTQPARAVDRDPFEVTVEIDAPPGATDDRWRCELSVAGQPRVITGHIWIAATGDPVPVDAGSVDGADDTGTDAVADGAARPTGGGGCRCRISDPTAHTRAVAAGWVLVVCVAAGSLAKRRRRAAARGFVGACLLAALAYSAPARAQSGELPAMHIRTPLDANAGRPRQVPFGNDAQVFVHDYAQGSVRIRFESREGNEPCVTPCRLRLPVGAYDLVADAPYRLRRRVALLEGDTAFALRPPSPSLAVGGTLLTVVGSVATGAGLVFLAAVPFLGSAGAGVFVYLALPLLGGGLITLVPGAIVLATLRPGVTVQRNFGAVQNVAQHSAVRDWMAFVPSASVAF